MPCHRQQRAATPLRRDGDGRRSWTSWSSAAAWSGPGAALDAVTRGLSTAIVEARDWASGTSSRSSKLIHGGLRYLEMLDFAPGPRGAARARPAAQTHRAAPGPAGAVPLPAARTGSGSGPTSGAGVAALRHDGRRARQRRGLPHHRHLTRARALREAPVPEAGLADRRDAVLRRPGRRRPAHDDRGPHRRRLRRAGRQPDPGRSTSSARASGSTGARVDDLETGGEFDVRAKQVINATGVWTDETQAMADTRGQFHVRASKGVHLVVPRDRIQSSTGHHPAHREERAVRHPVGPALDHRDHRHRLEPRPGAPGRDARRTSTTSSSTSTRCCDSPLTREDVEGVYAGLRPLLSGESESTSQAVPRARRRPPGARAGRGRRRQVHDLPGDGARTPSTRRCAAWTRPVPESVHRERAAARRRRLARRCGTSGTQLAARVRAARRPGSSTCSAGTASLVDEVLDADRATTRRWPSRCPAPTTTCGPRSVYAATHEGARHLDDVLARRTRDLDRGLGPRVSRRAGGRRADGAGRWAGTRHAARREVEHYLRAGRRPSASPSSSPTTRPPTPPAWAPPTSSPSGEPRLLRISYPIRSPRRSNRIREAYALSTDLIEAGFGRHEIAKLVRCSPDPLNEPRRFVVASKSRPRRSCCGPAQHDHGCRQTLMQEGGSDSAGP